MAHVFGHFKTITKHRHLVMRHCFKAGIGWQGLTHDLSKYSPAEFISGTKFYDGTRSPTEYERRKYGYSLAWMHHKGRNRHHFEYWTDVDPETHRYAPVKVPMRYVKEMLCDRMAASKVYRGEKYADGDPYDYFNHARGRDQMHRATAALLEKWLRLLAESGEDAVFKTLKAIPNDADYDENGEIL